MVEQEIRVHTPDGEMTTFVVHPDEGGQVGVAGGHHFRSRCCTWMPSAIGSR